MTNDASIEPNIHKAGDLDGFIASDSDIEYEDDAHLNECQNEDETQQNENNQRNYCSNESVTQSSNQNKDTLKLTEWYGSAFKSRWTNEYASKNKISTKLKNINDQQKRKRFDVKFKDISLPSSLHQKQTRLPFQYLSSDSTNQTITSHNCPNNTVFKNQINNNGRF